MLCFPARRALTRVTALLALPMALLAVPVAASATVAGPVQTEPASYGCTQPGFGGVADVTADLIVPVTATTGHPAPVALAIPAISLPSAFSAQLTGVTSYSVSTTQAGEPVVSDATTSYLSFTGHAVATGTAQIPAITASSSVTFVRPGYYSVSNLIAFTITPYRDGTALPVITCQTPYAGLVGYPVTVTAPGQPVYPGPEYTCSVNGNSGGKPGPIAFAFSVHGAATVGNVVSVTLTSAGGQSLGAPYVPGTRTVLFTATLPVTGVQTSSVPLALRTSDVTSPSLRVSGPLRLTRAGTDLIHFPARFTLAQLTPGLQPDASVMSCTMAPAPVQTWIALQVSPSSTPSTSPATVPAGGSGHTQGGGTAATGAVPAGAPNTGGGPRPGRDLPLAAVGLALLALGGGALRYATRRRALR